MTSYKVNMKQEDNPSNPSNHKKHWTEAEQKKLREFANAWQKEQSPFDFCNAVATDFNERKPDAIFLQLAKQGLLNENVTWCQSFNKDWQNGKYKTTSWANAKQETPQQMPVNQDNSSSTSENAGNSSLKLQAFQYSKPEDEQELSRFFHKALNDDEQPAPWCGVENGPTGLGKTHYMTKEIIAAIEKLIQHKKLPRLTILLVAPQHRHLDKIRDDIETHLTKNNLNKHHVALIKASSVIDMAKSQEVYLPQTCPHINDNSVYSKSAKQILDSMESLASHDNGNSQTGKTISEVAA